MAIPADKTPIQYYNDQITLLIKTREKFNNYYEDWATLPAGVKAGVKAYVSSNFTSVKTALDDVNAVIQTL